MSSKIQTRQGGGGSVSTTPIIQLDTLENSRKTFARIIEHYAAGEISENQSRAFCYMLGGFLSYWKLEADLSIQQDIEQIKAQLAELRQ